MANIRPGSATGTEARRSPRPGRLLRRIEENAADRRTGPVVVVAFGDSVTMGATAADTLEPDAVYHQRLKRMLEARFPRAVFSIINAGVGGETARDGLARIARDVLRHGPDLVLVGFGLNDASDEPGALAEFETNLHAIVKRIRDETPADTVALTPNFMATRDSAAVAEAHRPLLPRLMRLQNEGVLARFAAAVRTVAAAEAIAVADVYAAWQAMAERGVDTTAMLANGLNHPTAEAHEIAARCVMDAIVCE